MKKTDHHIRRLLPKLAALFAAIALCVNAFPALRASVGAVDVYQFSENGFYYTISAVSGNIEACVVGYQPVSGSSSSSSGVAIPATLGTYTVTSIGANAFSEHTDIKTVSIPQTVKSIGVGAFQNCTGLTNVTIAAGVTSISESSFKGCTALAAVNLPATVTSIGTSAFEDCKLLKTLTLPTSLTTIGNYAFRRCSTLETVVIPNSVTAMGEGAFEECTGLKKLTLSTALTRIEDFTFYRCSLLTPLTLTENITSIGRYAFSECTSLSSVTFPRSVLSIGASAFENCQYLAVAIIPNTVQYITNTSFRNDPIAIYGYTGTYAEQFAKENGIPFTSYGSVYKVTFSADIYNASVDNISVKSKSATIVPPSTVLNDEELTISATAPDGYLVDYITINDAAFSNGSVYRVHNSDVNIFVSYRLRDSAPTTSATVPVTMPVITTEPTIVTTVQPTQRTERTTVSPTTTDSNADTLLPTDDTDDPDDSDDTNLYVKVESNLNNVGGNNVKLITQRSNFIGSATVRLTNTAEADAAAQSALNAMSGGENMSFYAFDISLYDENGRKNSGIMSGGSITFQVPVPDNLVAYMDDLAVYHIVDGAAVLIPSTIIEDISGVKRVQFETDSFSPYMFAVYTDTDEIVTIDESDNPSPVTSDTDGSPGIVTIVSDNDPEVTTTKSSASAGIIDNGNSRPLNPGTGALLLIGIPSVTLGCALLIRKNNKEKRTRGTLF